MATSVLDQVEFVNRAQAGDKDAYAALFERFHERILNYVYRTLGDRQAAEDVTQEAFIQAYQKLHQLGPPHDFKSWVYRIAGNMALYRLRHRPPDRETDLGDREVGMPENGARPPEGEVLDQELGQAVRESLDRIPADYRQALILREIDGVPYREMAQILERSYDSVRQLVHRARMRFMDIHVGRMLLREGPSRCDALGDLLSGYRDGELDPEGHKRVEGHLESCQICQESDRRLRRAGTLLAALPGIEVMPVWKGQALQRVFDSSSAPAGGSQKLHPLGGARLWRDALPVAAVAAVAFVVTLTAAAGAAWSLAGQVWEFPWGNLVRKTVAPLTPAPSTTTGEPAVRPPDLATATLSPTPSPPEIMVETDSRCRSGPGPVYATVGYVNEGDRLHPIGRDTDSDWWWVERKGGLRPCWVWDGNVIAQGDTGDLPVMTPPTKPTFTPTPSVTPSPTATQAPPQSPTGLTIMERVCTPGLYRLTLTWTDQASNEDGFRLYRDGFLTAVLGSNVTDHIVYPPRGSPYTYSLEAFNESGSSPPAEVNEKGCS